MKTDDEYVITQITVKTENEFIYLCNNYSENSDKDLNSSFSFVSVTSKSQNKRQKNDNVSNGPLANT